MKPVRYSLFDSWRGFSLLSMIAYHAMYDLVAIYGAPISWYFDIPGYIWQQSICWSFILLSGICWRFGKNPLKRGLLTSFCGLLITAITGIFMPSQMVIMGVLSLLGAATLLMIPLSRMLKNFSAWWGMVFSALLFVITRNVNRGWLGFEGLNFIQLPQALYQFKGAFIWGFPPRGFFSSDYFSIVPWFFLFLFGYFLSLKIERVKAHALLFIRVPILEAIGRKSLVVYLLHQPLTLLAFYLVMR